MKRNKQEEAEDGPSKKLMIDEKIGESNAQKLPKKAKNPVNNKT